MSVTFEGTLFTGETLQGTEVACVAIAGRLESTDTARTIDVALAEVRVSDRLAHVPRFLYLPRQRTIETPDNAAVDALLAAQQRGDVAQIVHRLESHARLAAVATVLIVAITAAAIWWGGPVLARRTAQAVPADIERRAGQASLITLNSWLSPSQLDRAGRRRAQAQLDRLTQAGAFAGKPELVFRSMGGNFPNAFALPGGVIVVSDELVALANDDELAAVFAHEVAHWQRRHALQSVLRNSAALLVVSTVTGDLSTLTTFAGTIPMQLLQRGYSREFETEADADAVRLLVRARIDPASFASILEKLENARPATGQDFSYLSTHPGTADRVRAVQAIAKELGWTPPAVKSPAAQALPPKVTEASDVFDSTERQPDEQPRPISRQAPSYPSALRAAGISGSVTVEFIIEKTGDVSHVRVVRSSNPGFEDAAVAAILGWKFQPGRKQGRPVRVRASQLLSFDTHD